MTYTGPERRSPDRGQPVSITSASSGRAIIQAVAEQYGYTAEALIGRSQARDIVRVRGKAALAVARRFPNKSLSELGHLFKRSKQVMQVIIRTAKESEKIVSGNMGQEDYILEVEAQIRRISGVNLSHQVQHALEIQSWQAILLSILMEAYPRVMTYDQLLEAYEAAYERLYQESVTQKQDTLIRTFCHNIRRKFNEWGLENPVITVSPRGVILSHSAAGWLHSKFGKPVAVSSPVRLIA